MGKRYYVFEYVLLEYLSADQILVNNKYDKHYHLIRPKIWRLWFTIGYFIDRAYIYDDFVDHRLLISYPFGDSLKYGESHGILSL